MELVLTAEQKLIAEAAAAFYKDRGVSRLRALRDEARAASPPRAPTFSREVWQEMAELGWLGLTVPEELGGMGLGLAEAALVCEAAGRRLAPEPFIGSALYATATLVACGDEALKGRWLPRVLAGEAILAVAAEERRGRGDPMRCKTSIELGDDGTPRLSGEKIDVVAGAEADAFLVTARHASGGGIGLWLVERGAPGVTVAALDRVDAFPVARVSFEGVTALTPLSGAGATDTSGDGFAAFLRAREMATVALSAEMLGAMAAAFESTLAYLHERVQFGVKIGTFQALRHRAARAYVELELARSAVMAAAREVDRAARRPAQAGDARAWARVQQAVSLAKARCSEAFELVAAEAIQMFGGIGMTDEHDIGFYFKRARVAAATFGDAAFHRDRWARVAGY